MKQCLARAIFILFMHMTLSANFLWPAVGAHRGFFDFAFLLSIVLGLCIEIFFMRYLVPARSLKHVCMVVLVMNMASALFGGVFMSLIDLSLYYLFGIPWLWHMIMIYLVTLMVNVGIEGFVCLQFWPSIDKQKLLSVLAVANALSVGIALAVAKVL